MLHLPALFAIDKTKNRFVFAISVTAKGNVVGGKLPAFDVKSALFLVAD
ncbi:hypothetical protein QG087_08025 [Kingella kingae]|nr:hypothetical protein [Kingella kingae]MDK4656899.1 hypothetical protein [Kingella kingae]